MTSVANGVTGMQGEEGLEGKEERVWRIPVEVMTEYVKLQSLLCTLTIDYVRKNFLDGDIVKIEEPELVLFTVDKVRELLLPTFTSDGTIRTTMASAVVQHMKALVAKESHIFKNPMTEVQLMKKSYGDWMDFFEAVNQSN